MLYFKTHALQHSLLQSNKALLSWLYYVKNQHGVPLLCKKKQIYM